MTPPNNINKTRRAVLISGTAGALFLLIGLLCFGAQTPMEKTVAPAQTPADILLDAAQKGDCVLAAYACGQGADINRRDASGRTALAIAAGRGDADFTEVLLANGGKTEIADHLGDTPLVIAAGSGHLAVVKLLMKSGADGNTGSESCRTPLLAACENGHAEVVTYLLKNGVHRYPGVNQHQGPWVRSLRYRHFDVARALLAQDCDVNETDSDGNNVLMMAIKLRSEELVRQILERKTLNMDHRNKSGQTARQLAEKLNDKKIIQLLKDH